MAGVVGDTGGRMERDEGMRTEDMVGGCIFLGWDCMDIGVQGGMDGSGV